MPEYGQNACLEQLRKKMSGVRSEALTGANRPSLIERGRVWILAALGN